MFFISALNGNYFLMEELLNDGQNINQTLPNGTTALHIAVMYNRIDMVELLLKNGALVNMFDFQYGISPFQYAVHSRNTDVIKIFVQITNQQIHRQSNSSLLMLLGILRYSCDFVHDMAVFIVENLNANETGQYGTLLHLATRYNENGVVRQLCSNGFNINLQNFEGNTPLHIACRCENTRIALNYIKLGADLHRKNINDNMPLHVAVITNNLVIVYALIKYNADINAKGLMGMTALHMAVKLEKVGMVRLLVRHKADINILDNTGKSVLQYARHPMIVKYLYKKRKYPHSLHLCIKHGHLYQMIEIFKKHPNINAQICGPYTALHLAVLYGRYFTVEYLLRNGALARTEQEHQLTPLQISLDKPCSSRNEQTMRRLIITELIKHQVHRQIFYHERGICKRDILVMEHFHPAIYSFYNKYRATCIKQMESSD
jgi:ankyrin repeat protein